MLSLWISSVVGQVYDGQAIADAIESDSGNPAENHLSYANGLALTLSLLSSDQFQRVFDGTVVAPSQQPGTPEPEDPLPPDYTQTPEYQDALEEHAAAYQALQQANAALVSAQSEYDAMERDDYGLLNDGIPNNYGPALNAAAAALQQAENNVATAETNLSQAQATLDDIRENGP